MEKDKELYKEFIDGNIEALNELIKMYRTELIYFLLKFISDYHTAEDISQETFVYLMQHKEIYDFKYSFKTYLFTIGKSRALNYIKASKKLVFIEDNTEETSISEIADVEEDFCDKCDSLKVKDVIKKLKKEYQVVVCLVDLNGLSYEEAAIVMNRSISQVKSLIHNARKRLKELLEIELNEGVEHNEVNGGIHK